MKVTLVKYFKLKELVLRFKFYYKNFIKQPSSGEEIPPSDDFFKSFGFGKGPVTDTKATKHDGGSLYSLLYKTKATEAQAKQPQLSS